MIKLEIQYFTGCPNSQKMINNVSSAISQLDYHIEYSEILVETLEEVAETKFRGSPTLLVNGIDFENLPEPKIPSLACRYYQNGIPTINLIKHFINKVKNYDQ